VTFDKTQNHNYAAKHKNAEQPIHEVELMPYKVRALKKTLDTSVA